MMSLVWRVRWTVIVLIVCLLGGSVLAGTAIIQDTEAEIRAAQARLDELLQKYTDKHPDVIEARRELETLRKKLNECQQGADYPKNHRAKWSDQQALISTPAARVEINTTSIIRWAICVALAGE